MFITEKYPELFQVFNMAFGQASIGPKYDYSTWREAWQNVISLCSQGELVNLRTELRLLYAHFEDPAEFHIAIGQLGVAIWLEDEPGGILAWRDRVLRMLEDHMRERGISLD